MAARFGGRLMWQLVVVVTVAAVTLPHGAAGYKPAGHHGASVEFMAKPEEGTAFRQGRLRGVLVESALNHETVRPWKNFHRGQTGILFGNGESLNRYVHEERDEVGRPVVTFGSNHIIYAGLPVDHLFIADTTVYHRDNRTVVDENSKAIRAFRARQQKWFAYWRKKPSHGPSPDAARRASAKLIEVDGPHQKLAPLVKDVGTYIFGSMSSASVLALQFALYTGIDRLFIVGLDLSSVSATRHDLSPLAEMAKIYTKHPSRLLTKSISAMQEKANKKSSMQLIQAPHNYQGEVAMWLVASTFTYLEYPDVKVYLVNAPNSLRNQTSWAEVNTTNNAPLPFSSTSAKNLMALYTSLAAALTVGALALGFATSRARRNPHLAWVFIFWSSIWEMLSDAFVNHFPFGARIANNPEVVLLYNLAATALTFCSHAVEAGAEALYLGMVSAVVQPCAAATRALIVGLECAGELAATTREAWVGCFTWVGEHHHADVLQQRLRKTTAAPPHSKACDEIEAAWEAAPADNSPPPPQGMS